MSLSAEFQVLLDAIYKRFDESEQKIMDEISNLKVVNEQMKCRMEEAEKTIERQNEVILQMERRLNGNNLIIHGLNEIEEEHLEENVIGVLNNKLGVRLKSDDIQQVYRLGKKNVSASKSRPIKLQLGNHKTKLMIVRERRKLAGTSIYINEDLPIQLRLREAEKRRLLKGERGVKRLLNQSSEADEPGETISQNNKRRNDNIMVSGRKN